jgi:hypothetical protein
MHRKCSFDIDVITLQFRSQVAKAVANVHCGFLPPIFLSSLSLGIWHDLKERRGPN